MSLPSPGRVSHLTSQGVAHCKHCSLLTGAQSNPKYAKYANKSSTQKKEILVVHVVEMVRDHTPTSHVILYPETKENSMICRINHIKSLLT